MNALTVRLTNSIIGKALVETANESYEKRIDKMLSNSFDNVIKAIKTYKATRCNKSNGFFATDAIKYFDSKLEKEHEKEWAEIEDICDDNWYKVVEKFCIW